MSNIPPGSKILELGAGSGWQARLLSNRGFKVTAIDVEASPYAEIREFPVIEYDGLRLPFPDGEFDIIFSSNVLEHVPDVSSLLGEMARVLKRNGRAIHLMPTSSWRIWTSIAHYIFIIKYVFANAHREKSSFRQGGDHSCKSAGHWSKWLRRLFPGRHGERGNFITEVAEFSQKRWTGVFSKSGWRVDGMRNVNIFYTGYSICGVGLSLNARAGLARIFGGSCRAYYISYAG